MTKLVDEDEDCENDNEDKCGGHVVCVAVILVRLSYLRICVIPAKAGIQNHGPKIKLLVLDPCLRRGDTKVSQLFLSLF